MTTFRLERHVRLPRPLDEVFPFFADAANLERITPDFLRFRIVSPQPVEMKVGATIDYELRVHGIPLTWTSEISVWEPPFRFVDRQIRGPYRLWHHEHLFRADGDHTVCTDLVDYAVPGGRLVNALFVRRDVERIFDHRTRVLEELFPAREAVTAG
jgi:ligand-binding SRPBCC domain-containing protein